MTEALDVELDTSRSRQVARLMGGPVGIPWAGADRVVGEHIGVLGQLEAEAGELGADRLSVLPGHRARKRVNSQVPVLVGLGVLSDSATADHDVVEGNVKDAFL